MKPEIVIYHANCDDGFCAAWLHHRIRRGTEGRDAEYVAANYDDDPPDVTGRDVLIFDFSYPRDVLVKMHGQANSLLVFDHHKTAQKNLAGLDDFCTFDMDKSGARLALEYLRPESEWVAPLDLVGENWLIDHVEDRDMFWFRLPSTHRITAALRSYPRRFDVWDQIWEVGGVSLASEGRHILRYQRQIIDAATSDANVGWCWIGANLVPVVNNTLASLTSDIVGELAKLHEGVAPFAAGFFVLPDGAVVYNLRSRGTFDVSEVAQLFGGGGHRNAAGFKIASVPEYESPPEREGGA